LPYAIGGPVAIEQNCHYTKAVVYSFPGAGVASAAASSASHSVPPHCHNVTTPLPISWSGSVAWMASQCTAQISDTILNVFLVHFSAVPRMGIGPTNCGKSLLPQNGQFDDFEKKADAVDNPSLVTRDDPQAINPWSKTPHLDISHVQHSSQWLSSLHLRRQRPSQPLQGGNLARSKVRDLLDCIRGWKGTDVTPSTVV
jgi:hypothetical protein